ncbi:hypothetical protein AGMMS4952_25940 [Spirochaetia bacterium]|nr:hypothetical protein AGMMS4952_25940 [Spirochaetia bacterium]
MTLEMNVDIPASRHLTLEVPQEVPEGKVKVAFTPLSTDPVKPGVIFNPAKLAEPRLPYEEARDRIQALFADSKFSVDSLLEERREDLEHEDEKYRRLFHKE